MKKGCVIGIDFGTKRVGVAITDELQMIASPHATVHAQQITDFLKRLIAEKNIVAIVVGEPKSLDGSATDSTEQVHQFVKHMKRTFPSLTIEMLDERFTSKMAASSLIESGVPKSKRQNKETLDQISAAIILQSWLEKQKNIRP